MKNAENFQENNTKDRLVIMKHILVYVFQKFVKKHGQICQCNLIKKAGCKCYTECNQIAKMSKYISNEIDGGNL